MHASISRFAGDPDRLLRSYDAMIEEVGGAALTAHLCLRAPDGIVVVDTCPTQEAFERFHAAGGAFAALRRRHGLPDPVAVDDLPVHAAFGNGAPIAVREALR